MLNSFTVGRHSSPKNSPKRRRHEFGANLNLELLEDRQLMAHGAVHQVHSAVVRLDSTVRHTSHAQIMRFDHLRNTTTGATLISTVGAETQVPVLVQSNPSGPLTPTSLITIGLQTPTQSSTPGTETQVPRLVQSNPSGPLTPTSLITIGLQPPTQGSTPGSETQVPRLVQSNPSGPLTPTSLITIGLQTPTQSSTPGTETKVTELVQSNPSGPLTPTSHINEGLTP